ncbi:hypothetical protein [Chrysiogenes arsenatis]|uniref:hypothetical protein n=1 Tax=Chrysiogenes arsenatis TaxID=309797 RepID=UPI0004077A77|nr:hypothetical protein [Chrysiogenes arsenatis]
MNPLGPIAHINIIGKINMVEKLQDAMDNRQQQTAEKIVADAVQQKQKEMMETVKSIEETGDKEVDDREGREKQESSNRNKKKQHDKDEDTKGNRAPTGHIDFLA